MVYECNNCLRDFNEILELNSNDYGETVCPNCGGKIHSK